MTDSIKSTLLWAYERSRFYRDFYDSSGFSPEAFAASQADMNVPVISWEIYRQASFFDLLTIPLNGAAETWSVQYKNQRLLWARSTQEKSDSIEATKGYLESIGINRASIVALDGLSSMEYGEISNGLSMLGANIFYLPADMSCADKIDMLRAIGADTIITYRDSYKNYTCEKQQIHLETLFRAIMISDTMANEADGEVRKYEACFGAPVYEVISLPFTPFFIDLHRTGNNELVPRDSLLIRPDGDGIVLTDVGAMTIPFIGIKVER